MSITVNHNKINNHIVTIATDYQSRLARTKSSLASLEGDAKYFDQVQRVAKELKDFPETGKLPHDCNNVATVVVGAVDLIKIGIDTKREKLIQTGLSVIYKSLDKPRDMENGFQDRLTKLSMQWVVDEVLPAELLDSDLCHQVRQEAAITQGWPIPNDVVKHMEEKPLDAAITSVNRLDTIAEQRGIGAGKALEGESNAARQRIRRTASDIDTAR